MISANLRGTFSQRPAATSVRPGTSFQCTDLPFMYLSDGSNWFQHNVPFLKSPAVVGNYTVVGNAKLSQVGDSLHAVCYSNDNAHSLAALQSSLSAAPYWVALGMWWLPRWNTTYPMMGVCVTNGTTSGTSTGVTCSAWVSGFLTQLDCFAFTLNGARGTDYINTSSGTMTYAPSSGGLIWLRLLDDSTNFHFQNSVDGVYWEDFGTAARTAGMTNWGIQMGNGAGGGSFGQSSGIIAYNAQGTAPQTSVTGANTSSPIQITVSSTASFQTGDYVSVAGVNGQTGANGTRWPITVDDSTHMTLLTSTTVGAWTSGGTVTLISR
jgi:hypothetical protein